jgi:protease-4
MKDLLTSFLGALLAILLIGALTAGIGSCVAGKKSKIEDHSWLIIEMNGDLLEYDPPGGIISEISGGDTETLQRILSNFEKAARDDRIQGVIFKVSMESSAGWAKTMEIREAVKRFRDLGKKVYGWAESFTRDQYPLLSACDEIYAPPTAYIQFHGVAMDSPHVRQALDKLGISADLHKIEDYKSAAELVTRDDLSEPARENRQWIADDMWEMFLQMLEQERDLNEAKIEELMGHALFTAQEALDGGLIDALMYWDEVEKQLKQEGGDDLKTVGQARYAEVRPEKLELKGDKTIAVIHAQGTIIGRESGVNPLLGLTMGHESVIRQFRQARKDDDVAAIVFRVDSPGGDALGSDLMGHEVEVTAGVKPVVVSMVDVAASGGYHIAYRASKIVANPMTITGSIGSISGKFNMSGLYDKLGITFDTSLSKGPMARIDSDLRDYTPEERARFEQNHWAGFNDWLRDVAEHRGMSFEDAEQLAHGRVWTGRQALENGLIDELGDLQRSIEIAKELAGIAEQDPVSVLHLPEKQGLFESLMGGDDAVTIAARWAVYRSLRETTAETLEILATRPELFAD